MLGFVALAGAWRWGTFNKRTVLGSALALRLLAFPLTPALSDDGFRYVWDGLVQVEVGDNPYRLLPEDKALQSLQGEDFYALINSKGYYSVYPPVSQVAFALGALGYAGGWEGSWYLIKFLFLVAEGLGLWLLSRMVPARSLVLYAWNPLVVMEVAGQAHTEALAVPFLILMVWASEKGRGRLSAVAVMVAGWVKLVPFLLLPLVARRHGVRVLLPAVFVSALLTLPYAASYVPDNVFSSLRLYTNLFEFNAGPYYALKVIMECVIGPGAAEWLGSELLALFLLMLLGLYMYDLSAEFAMSVPATVVLGLFLACATTMHPWYLIPLLALLPLLVHSPTGRLFSAAWLWLAAWSMATYWHYTGPTGGYETAVAVGWGGWGVLLAAAGWTYGLPSLMRARAARKWEWVYSTLPVNLPLNRVLDLGAGDGYVGEQVVARTGANVVLADVVDFNRTTLPLVLYDGRMLPFERGAFDLTLLSFVLHLSADPGTVLREAGRVTKGHVVVVESVEESRLQRRLFEPLDRVANRLRSAGAMGRQEAHLHVRTAGEWEALFEIHGFEVVRTTRRGRGVHRQRLFVLKPLLQ